MFPRVRKHPKGMAAPCLGGYCLGLLFYWRWQWLYRLTRAKAALHRAVLLIIALIPAGLFTCLVIICLIKLCYGDY